LRGATQTIRGGVRELCPFKRGLDEFSAKAKESWASVPGLLGLAVKEYLGGGLEGNWPQAHIIEKRLGLLWAIGWLAQ
jgi:hypothetical protein